MWRGKYQQGFLPFLDYLTSQGPNGTLITMVYRKPTNTDQYLHLDIHHSITNKYSIYSTLSLRAWYVWSTQQLLEQENQHIQTALHRCNYLVWVFHRLQSKIDFQLIWKQWHNNTNLHSNTNKNYNTFTVVPYFTGLSESFRNICGKAGVQVHFKGAKTV